MVCCLLLTDSSAGFGESFTACFLFILLFSPAVVAFFLSVSRSPRKDAAVYARTLALFRQQHGVKGEEGAKQQSTSHQHSNLTRLWKLIIQLKDENNRLDFFTIDAEMSKGLQ